MRIKYVDAETRETLDKTRLRASEFPPKIGDMLHVLGEDFRVETTTYVETYGWIIGLEKIPRPLDVPAVRPVELAPFESFSDEITDTMEMPAARDQTEPEPEKEATKRRLKTGHKLSAEMLAELETMLPDQPVDNISEAWSIKRLMAATEKLRTEGELTLEPSDLLDLLNAHVTASLCVWQAVGLRNAARSWGFTEAFLSCAESAVRSPSFAISQELHAKAQEFRQRSEEAARGVNPLPQDSKEKALTEGLVLPAAPEYRIDHEFNMIDVDYAQLIECSASFLVKEGLASRYQKGRFACVREIRSEDSIETGRRARVMITHARDIERNFDNQVQVAIAFRVLETRD